MTLRAHIRDDWTYAGISIVFARTAEGQPTLVWAPGQPGAGEITDGRTEPTIEPLRLYDDEGRVLLAALLRHYEGSDDTRALRKDYDAERARVDRLIGALLPGGVS